MHSHQPSRAKGPLVWLDMDQQALDDAYDQAVYAPNREAVRERRAVSNAVTLKILGKPERVAYGSADIEKLDIYRTKRANAPVNIYIHGGAWRGGSAAQTAYLAETFVNAGAHFVTLDFNNVEETGGDLFPMVDQVRRATAWVYQNAARFGGDAQRLYVTGHSSGGHLASCVVITEWERHGLPREVLRAALLGSGMYDLKPVRLSKRGNYVKFTDAMEEELSAQRHLDKVHIPLTITCGTLETPEFQRQARDFHAALTAAGKPAKLLIGTGYNHFETQETLANPYGFMGRAALEMMGLAPFPLVTDAPEK